MQSWVDMLDEKENGVLINFAEPQAKTDHVLFDVTFDHFQSSLAVTTSNAV